VTRALKTLAEVEQDLTAARARVRDCEDCGDPIGADLARCECDELMDLWMRLPRPRTP
jgi:hypothetical protein